MSQRMEKRSLQDPYQILEIPYTASEEQIRQAFHKKMVETNGSEIIIAAYGEIRDSAGRKRFRWGSLSSFLRDPQQEMKPSEKLDVDTLIKELAFQTEWELGDETCLK